MYILTYRNYPELPKSKNKFYWNVFDTLCTKHDSISKKGAYVHEKKSKLQNEDFEKILRWFCYVSVLEERFNFDEQYLSEKFQFIKQALNFTFEVKDLIYDLTVSISIIVVEGLDYKFPHRTIQDYFMVLYIKEQNEDAKKSIYQEKFQKIYPINTNKNIFDLCIELDKEPFFKFYVLPLFEEFKTSYSNIGITENAMQFLRISDVQFSITYKEEISMRVVSRRIISHIDISNFYGVRFQELFEISASGKLENHQLLKRFIDTGIIIVKTHLEDKSGYFASFRVKDLSDQDLKEFILEYFNVTLFETIIEKIKNLWLRLLEEHKKDQQANNALTEFVNPRS